MKLTKPLIAIFITLLLFGAKEQDSTAVTHIDFQTSNTYFLKAKVDGKWITFNQDNELTASFGPYIDNVYDGAIKASSLESAEQSVIANISIMIRQKGKIGVGSYSGGKFFEYGFKGVTLSYAEGKTMAVYVTDVNNPQSFLKITQLSDTHVKGNFSGEVFNITNKNKISITDGEFSLKNTSF